MCPCHTSLFFSLPPPSLSFSLSHLWPLTWPLPSAPAMLCFWKRIIKYNTYQTWTSGAGQGEVSPLSMYLLLITTKNMAQTRKATNGGLKSKQQADWGGASKSEAATCIEGSFPLCFVLRIFFFSLPGCTQGWSYLQNCTTSTGSKTLRGSLSLWPEDWEKGSLWADKYSRDPSYFPYIYIFLIQALPPRWPPLQNSTVAQHRAKTLRDILYFYPEESGKRSE